MQAEDDAPEEPEKKRKGKSNGNKPPKKAKPSKASLLDALRAEEPVDEGAESPDSQEEV